MGMTFTEFMTLIKRVEPRLSAQRPGQVLYNTLTSFRPMIAEDLIATCNDPYYAHDTADPRYVAGVAYIQEHWDDAYHS